MFQFLTNTGKMDFIFECLKCNFKGSYDLEQCQPHECRMHTDGDILRAKGAAEDERKRILNSFATPEYEYECNWIKEEIDIEDDGFGDINEPSHTNSGGLCSPPTDYVCNFPENSLQTGGIKIERDIEHRSDKCNKEKQIHREPTAKQLRLFKCAHCSFKTKYKQSLHNHLTRIHEGVKPFKCDKCEYSAHTKAELNKYLFKIHGIKNGIECSMRGRGRPPKVALKETPLLATTTCTVILSHINSDSQIQVLAIIDHQASISLLDPTAIQRLHIPREQQTNDTVTITTIQGTQSNPCKQIQGLIIETIDRKQQWPLPSIITHKPLPDISNEIPTRKDVASIPGISHLAKQSSGDKGFCRHYIKNGTLKKRPN